MTKIAQFRRIAAQEVRAKQQKKVGVVLSQRRIRPYDATGGGSPRWVADVDMGLDGVLQEVPIKGGTDGSMRFADRGQTVELTRNTVGRWDITGPGDHLLGIMGIREIDLTDGSVFSTTSQGFTTVQRPYSYYQGPTSLAQGNPNFTFDQVPAANDTLTRDAGSFIDDGFVMGAWILVRGTVSNDGPRGFGPIAVAPTATVLEFAGDVFVDEGPINGIEVGFGSRWGDGVTDYPKFSVLDAQGNEVL